MSTTLYNLWTKQAFNGTEITGTILGNYLL